MFEWLRSPVNWTGDHKSLLLSEDNNSEPTPDVSLADLINQSSTFPLDFPVESVRCCQLRQVTSEKQLEKNINSAYPVIHEYALYLCSVFLLYQRKFGLKTDFYKNMSLIQFINRLLSKRAAVFVDSSDSYLLLSGERGSGNWENVGTIEEKPPLVLENCLSYDEMKLSALLSVSSHSYFINNGDRNNFGRFDEDRRRVEENGVIIGVIGPRFEKAEVMEYRDVVKTKRQNTVGYGYGDSPVPTLQGEFAKFYEVSNDTYSQFLENKESTVHRYLTLGT